MKNKNTSRRDFIATTGKAGMALGLSASILPSLANRFKMAPAAGIPYTQQALPYAYKDLEVAIDALTMEIHYSKHAAAYAKNLADAAVAEKIDTKSVSLEDLLSKVSKYSPKVRNNGGGHFNHEFFWQSMSPKSTAKPEGKLLSTIEKDFGCLQRF